MPRTPRGGMRVGTPGAAYPNRTDLTANHSLPARAAPHQTYGAVTAQVNAQRAVPMGPPQAPGLNTGPAARPAAPPGGFVRPGAMGALDRPTERPLEPVTTGIPSGPGPGPEILPQGPSSSSVSALLQRFAAATGSSTLSNLAARAQAAGQ